MNGSEPKIEIFKPFGEAFELTKRILFQPFDLTKWLVIGFAAFLANLSGSGVTGFRPPAGSNWMNHVPTDQENVRSFIEQIGPTSAIAIGIGILVLVAMIVVLAWLSARGRFIFTDCIVRNRAAIVQPWHEYRIEGNNYFIFWLFAAFVIIALVVAFIILPLVPVFLLGHRDRHIFSGETLLFVLFCIGFFVLMFVFAMLMQFVMPVMYRRRCKAWPAFLDVVGLFGNYFGPFVLYFLFSIVLGIATVFVVVAATCATCCIVAIPYVGTVILLPLFVLLRSFLLCFLRQFGPDYDVWAGIPQPEPPPIPPSIPPPLPA